MKLPLGPARDEASVDVRAAGYQGHCVDVNPFFRMRILLFICAALCVLGGLMGCVGITVSTGGHAKTSHVSGTVSIAPVVADQGGQRSSDQRNLAPTNRKEIVDAERNWCGVTIWVVVPIPLILPVCSAHTEVIYVDNRATAKTEVRTKHRWMVCGPLLWMGSALAMPGGARFCDAFDG